MATAVAAGWFVLALVATTDPRVSIGVPIALWCVFIALGLGTWRWAFVPRITLTPTAVEAVNRVTSVRVPYAEIATARVGYNGITMTTHAGTRVSAWAVQKSSIARWARKRTYGDDVVAAILARAAVPNLSH
jgi:hypothetical protein